MKNKGFKVFYTTADIGISVKGKTLENLFKNAAKGLSYLLVKKINSVNSFSLKKIKLKAPSTEGFLVKFLNELLFFYETEFLLYKDVKFHRFSDLEIIADIEFINLTDGNFTPFYDIKAATYHNLKIVKKRVYYYANIIFDI